MISAILFLIGMAWIVFCSFMLGHAHGRRSIANVLLMAHAADGRDAVAQAARTRCEDCSTPVKPSDFPTLCDACLMDRVSVSSSGLMAEAV